MHKLLLPFLCLLPLLAHAQLVTPSEFLPHDLGSTFTPHHLLVDYVQHVGENSPRARVAEYGRTNEQRPLLLAYVSTPENMARLEAIRENNLRATGLLPGATDPALNDIAIVWLSYSVHGNEAAGSEASMRVLYELANPANTQTGNWLDNTVVIIDPSLNPDGYNRYTNWYRQVANTKPDPNPAAREHNEPWPGGRVNHYLFDLNRDWAWQTQVESQQRMVKYQEWMPHIHADLHEQGYTSPYYFAPAAAPFHEYITDWQGDFQTEIGKNHAGYFDDEGWLYFTRERFDLLYPSYGDTYPTFNGSIGMTYEQGGHSRAGRAIDLPNGDTLTLQDRIDHHKTTSLSTVEIASRESNRITENFRKYFDNARQKPSGQYLSYVVSGKTPAGKMNRLRKLLDRNGIRYGRANSNSSGNMYSYRSRNAQRADISAGDLVIPAKQPRSVLAQVLFDPDVVVEDSVTYDITAWSIPLAYNLDAYASTSEIPASLTYDAPPSSAPSLSQLRNAYAVVIPWSDVNAVSALGDLVARGVQVRTAGKDFSFGPDAFKSGALVISRADNRKVDNYIETVHEVLTERGVGAKTLNTGFSTSGGDIGSGSYQLVSDAKIAILGGEGVSPNEFGQVWWYFDRELGYPASVFDPKNLSTLLRSDYDVIILPEGRYQLKAHLDALKSWIRGGGKLIAIGRANSSLAGLEGFDLTVKKADREQDSTDIESKLQPYAGQERRFISGFNPGAVVALEMDETHPLASGIGDRYYSLTTGSTAYEYLADGQNVGRIRSNPDISGFMGANARAAIEETLVFGVQDMGRGQVVYLIDNPLYRGFWEEGKLLFGNAVFLVR